MRIPKVLEQRVLIDEDDRRLLKTMEELSPKDTGRFMLTPSIFEDYVPTVSKISEVLGKSKKEVWNRMNKIAKIWQLPDSTDLPTNNGFFDNEDALVSALVNQHKQRFDKNFGDYRVPKIHMFSAEMGTGTLYTNNDAFKGEQLIRQSLGLDEVMGSYHMQGGVMPEMIQMFGKAKNKRAILTGLNKTGKEVDPKELDLIKKELALLNEGLERKSALSEKEINNLKKYVVNTLGSLEEAAESAAHEILPIVKNIPKTTPIHIYFSYNDDANKSEIEDQHIAILRQLHSRMASATKELPKLKEQYNHAKSLQDSLIVEREIANIFYNYLQEKRDELEGSFEERGPGFKGYVAEFFDKNSPHYKDLRKNILKELKEITMLKQSDLESIFYNSNRKFIDEHTTFKKVMDKRGRLNNKNENLENRLHALKNKINEAKTFEYSLLVEQMEGHSWFTKKIAIKPSQAKALETIKKSIYKEVYSNMISKLKELAGQDLNIKLHTDDIITIEVPDPQHVLDRNDDPDRPIGTLITSHPRTNSQRSNEPLKESFAELIRFHEGKVSTAVKKGKYPPTKLKEFNKRDFAFSDIYITSYGADGYKQQKKFIIDPTTIKGEYSKGNKITTYIKLPTRHDTSKLGELMVKGNKGTWQGKRIDKGGDTTGPVLYIEHPDMSSEQIFFDDDYLSRIGREYGEKFDKIENKIRLYKTKIQKTKEDPSKKKYKLKLKGLEDQKNKLLDEIRPSINRVFLENDIHLGAFSTPGSPFLVDGVLSSQLAAIQAYGFSGIDYAIMTEALHGEQAWRSYDSTREGFSEDPLTHMKKMQTLEAKLKEKQITKKDVDEMKRLVEEEFVYSVPSFMPEEQKEMFLQVLAPINREMMDKEICLFTGAGNHWMNSGKGKSEDEANVMQSLLGSHYKDQGLLVRGQRSSGQSFGFDSVVLPGLNEEGVKAAITHKMWHGTTEISQIANQLVRIRDPAVYVFTADRHHPGAIAEKGKMGVLDIGKQPTIVYRKMIGKSCSIRGTMVAGYDPSGNNGFLSTRYFANDIIEAVSGWEYKGGLLKRANSLIEEGMQDNSILVEKKKIDYALERSKNSHTSEVIEKYSRK